jgi:hypothetical protein
MTKAEAITTPPGKPPPGVRCPYITIDIPKINIKGETILHIVLTISLIPLFIFLPFFS